METYTNTFGRTAAEALPAERAAFIRKTYIHLAGAIAVFILIEAFLLNLGLGEIAARTMMGSSFSWFIVLAAFIGISTVANSWAISQTSKSKQYLGLGVFILAWSVMFLPLLFIINRFAGTGVIMQAGVVTLGLFLGITAVVFLTRSDFSFLGPILSIAGFVSLGYIAIGLIFGFSFGSFFAFAMVAFAGGSILYQTSNVLHQYRTDQHVAASLSLFSGIALMFWYILQIFYSRR